jgi:hypothetical protein
MDSSIQLKNNLISRIQNSKDLNFLKAIQTIFDTSEQALFELNEKQRKSIEIGRNQIKNGDFKENAQVLSDLREWLKK